MKFLDNVLQDFIDNAPETMKTAAYSAMRERSVGLGVMGLHSFFQENNVPWEGVTAKSWNKKIFSHIKERVDQASKDLAEIKGPCPDAEEYGIKERFSNKTAIAPTASISIICGGTSPGIEPIAAKGDFSENIVSDIEEYNQAQVSINLTNFKKIIVEVRC